MPDDIIEEAGDQVSSTMKNILHFNVHGVKVAFESQDRLFAQFVEGNYRHFMDTGGESDLEVSFNGYHSWPYSCTRWLRRGREKALPTDLTKLDRRLYFRAHDLIWEDTRFSISIRVGANKLKVKGRYFEDLEHLPARLFLGRKRLCLEAYQQIMRYILHFPIFWILATRQKKYLIHASAVERNGKGIIFAGLNGVGKSTLALYFLERGYKLLSDNFLIFDRQKLYSFPEVLRISARTVKLLGVGLGSKVSSSLIFGKQHYILDGDKISSEAVPEKIFLLCLSRERAITKVPPSVLRDSLIGMHHYLGEFPEYSYLSAMHYVDKGFDWEDQFETLTYLLEHCECYLLENGRNQSLDGIEEEVERASVDSW